MALIRCPECQREVSGFATTCPCCGFPIKKHSLLKKTVNFFRKVKKATWFVKTKEKITDVFELLWEMLKPLLIFAILVVAILFILALANTYEIAGIILFIIFLIGGPIVAYFESYVWSSRRRWYFPLVIIVEIMGILAFVEIYFG